MPLRKVVVLDYSQGGMGISGVVNGGGKVDHMGGSIVGLRLSTSSEKQPSCVSRGRDGGIPGPPSFRHAVEHG